MGVKGYRLWVMGQLDSTCRAPPRRSVAQYPEIRSHIYGRLKAQAQGLTPGALKLWVNLI
jgi:hypothetical protein